MNTYGESQIDAKMKIKATKSSHSSYAAARCCMVTGCDALHQPRPSASFNQHQVLHDQSERQIFTMERESLGYAQKVFYEKRISGEDWSKRCLMVKRIILMR